MHFFIDILKGIGIGAGAILPGISSGVLCVIFGIYEKLVDSVLGIFKDFKKNFFYLFPFAIGSIIGVILFGKVLNYLFINYEVPTKVLFVGLILGCIPTLLKEANSKNEGFYLHDLLFTLSSFLLGIFMVLLEHNFSDNLAMIHSSNPIWLAISGFCMSIGIVVPGISSTVILMCLGSYYTYLQAVSSLSFAVLIPMGIGCIIGGILFLKIIQFLLKNYHRQTLYTIIGFVLGSVLVLFPGFETIGLLEVLVFIIGLFIAFKFER